MKKLIILLLLLASPAMAQVAVAPAPLGRQQFFGANGAPLASGCLFTYLSTTSTPQATYSDYTGTALNSNPIILDSGGFASIWLTNNTYRFVLVSAGGVNCSTGTTQSTIDGISAYTVISSPQNLFLLGATSDPGGSAGELSYRTDIPCFRGFTTFWDCFVELTLAQTLTNKTVDISANTLKTSSNVAGHYPRNNGTQYVDSAIQTGDVSVVTQTYPNNSPGTGVNLLAYISPLGTNQVGTLGIAAVAAGTLADGVCISGCGASGTATLVAFGQVGCIFDNPSTGGDFVTSSATIAGNCHDAGFNSYPSTGQVVGRVAAGNAVPAGLNTIVFWGAGVKSSNITVGIVNLTAQGANITSTPIITPTANGFYRASCYLVITQAATSTSTLPVCSVTYTDADSSVAETQNLTTSSAANTLGTTSALGASIPYFYAKSGVAISYVTTGYATSGATPMLYAIHLRLEGPL